MISIEACKGCHDRAVGCHGSCQKYLGERAAVQRERAGINKVKDVEKEMDDYIFRWSNRNKWKRR